MVVDGFSSGIRLTDVSGPVRVKTFSGEVNVEARAWADGDDLNINTFSGGVTVQLPDSARGNIDFDTFSGSSRAICRSRSRRAAAATSAAPSMAAETRDFRLKTFSGDVTIKR